MRFLNFRKIVLWQDIALILLLHGIMILMILSGLLPALRAFLSLVCLLFAPGYTTLALLYPDGKGIDRTERFGLSPIVSIAVLIPLGLLLNYSAWGLRLDALLGVFTGYSALVGGGALWRRSHLDPTIQFALPAIQSGRAFRRILPLILIICVSSIAVWGFLESLVAESGGERYTEFYLLGSDGMADQYPKQAAAGEPFPLIVGIINHEQKTVLYHVVLMEMDGRLQRIADVTLESGQTWEQPCMVTLSELGEKSKVNLLLFREEDSNPYRSLQLWISVFKPENASG